MRTGVSIAVSPSDRRRLEALIRNRNTVQKHVWRAEIVLLSADGVGTLGIMRRTGKSKTCVWRWQERFFNTIERQVLVGKSVHVSLHADLMLMAQRGRGLFAKLTKRRLKRGTFNSLVDLQAVINRFVAEQNADPKPFTWTADPDRIIAAVRRGHQMLDSIR